MQEYRLACTDTKNYYRLSAFRSRFRCFGSVFVVKVKMKHNLPYVIKHLFNIIFHYSYRFMDLFTDVELVRDMQKELDVVIQQGVVQITRLLRNSETGISSGAAAAPDEDEFAVNRKKQNYLRGKTKYLSAFPVLFL